MIEHDGHVGKLLKALDDLGIANNTIVIYTTDNGPHMNSWPDGGDDAVPQREEHQLGGRLPGAGDGPLAGPHQAPARSPTRSSPGSTGSRRWSPRPATPTSRTGCSRAATPAGRTFKVHLDGYNQLPYLTGQAGQVGAQGVLLLQRRRRAGGAALRELEGRVLRAAGEGTLQVWAEPFSCLRVPKHDQPAHGPLRAGADITSNTYYDWSIRHAFLVVPAQDVVASSWRRSRSSRRASGRGASASSRSWT